MSIPGRLFAKNPQQFLRVSLSARSHRVVGLPHNVLSTCTYRFFAASADMPNQGESRAPPAEEHSRKVDGFSWRRVVIATTGYCFGAMGAPLLGVYEAAGPMVGIVVPLAAIRYWNGLSSHMQGKIEEIGSNFGELVVGVFIGKKLYYAFGLCILAYTEQKIQLTAEEKEHIHKVLSQLNVEDIDTEIMLKKNEFYFISDGASTITREQMSENAAERFGENAQGNRIKMVVDVLFSLMDVDNSNSISFEEFICGWALIKAALDQSSPEAVRDFTFRALDIDNDGFISESELQSCIKVLLALNAIPNEHRIFHKSLHPSPYRSATPEEICSKFMSLYDTNDDGKISKDEFDAVSEQVIDISKVISLLK